VRSQCNDLHVRDFSYSSVVIPISNHLQTSAKASVLVFLCMLHCCALKCSVAMQYKNGYLCMDLRAK